MNYADEIIGSTKVLAEKCTEALDNPKQPIHILPNLPLESLSSFSDKVDKLIEEKEKNSGKSIVLTSGTLSHKQILIETIFPVLSKLMDDYPDASLTTIGQIQLPSYFEKYQGRSCCIPFTDYESYLNQLSRADLALVPLEKHTTTDGKSAIKWMEASYCGVPCICSPVRAYTDVTSNQVDVLIAKNSTEWEQSMRELLQNPQKARI